nr:MAG TPA: hypothetical protein [Caudoviricetes sp.]
MIFNSIYIYFIVSLLFEEVNMLNILFGII